MEINVSIYEIEGNSNLKAYASIELDKKIAITGIRIVEGKNGLFVAMPSRKTTEGEYKDTVFPITKEFREDLFNLILEEYSVKTSKKSSKSRKI